MIEANDYNFGYSNMYSEHDLGNQNVNEAHVAINQSISLPPRHCKVG